MVQKRLYILIVIIILLPACKIDRKKRIDRDKVTFQIADDSFLFFKNVRQIYYDFQDLPRARWYAYRLGNRLQDEQRPVITPVIVIDWFNDEGYILVEPNSFLQDESVFVVQERNSKGTVFEYTLKERGRENMLEFATKIYEGVMADNVIMIQSGGKFYPLFKDDEDRDNFRIVMADYYRLTGVF